MASACLDNKRCSSPVIMVKHHHMQSRKVGDLQYGIGLIYDILKSRAHLKIFWILREISASNFLLFFLICAHFGKFPEWDLHCVTVGPC